MISVNLLLPDNGNILNIRCDEGMETDSLMKQIEDLLMEKRMHRGGWLCHVDKRRLLSHHESLKANGIIDGSNLIPV